MQKYFNLYASSIQLAKSKNHISCLRLISFSYVVFKDW